LNTEKKTGLYVLGGVSGITGTLCYIAAIAIPLDRISQYITAMAWPVLSIIFVHSIYRYISIERQTAANQLSFLFACLGFSMVACMLSVQLAVEVGMEDYFAVTPDKVENLKIIKHSLRLIDQGIDVAWDIFIGTSLIFLFFSIKGHPHFRLWWSIPSFLLGLTLIILNVIAFPFPPDSKGLFDIGPGIGLYIIILSTRLIWLGSRMKSNK
jgi:hypothetical protein